MPDRIEIVIPEWAKDNNIYIMAGIELLAFRQRGGPLMVKTSRCNMCGKCCTGFNKWIYPLVGEDRACVHLKKEVGDNDRWICDLSTQRPHGCNTTAPWEKDYCSVEFVEVV